MSEGKDDKWEMPKPVFRSSAGSLPKSFEETISQSFSPDKTGEIDADDDILGVMEPVKAGAESSEEVVDDHAEPADPEEAAEAAHDAMVETEPKRRTFWSFTTIFLLIVLLAAAAAVGVFYYLSHRPAADPALQ